MGRVERPKTASPHSAASHGAPDPFAGGGSIEIRAADRIGAHVDVDALCSLAGPVAWREGPFLSSLPPLGRRIAVALDDAFAFVYPSVLDGWRDKGAEVVTFSPLNDEPPPSGCDALYLPGGYPELHAGVLAGNARFMAGVRAAASRLDAIFGECGGYMVLGDGLIDANNHRHAMAGVLPLVSSFARRRLHLGYRTATLTGAGPLGKAGCVFRGHEFHYATIISEGPGEALFSLADARGQPLGQAGLQRAAVMGSFVHLIDSR